MTSEDAQLLHALLMIKSSCQEQAMDPCNFLASRSLKNQQSTRRQSETVEAFYQEHGSGLLVELAQWWTKRKEAKPANSEKPYDLGAFALTRRRKVT